MLLQVVVVIAVSMIAEVSATDELDSFQSVPVQWKTTKPADMFDKFPDMSKKAQRNFTRAEVAQCDGGGGRALCLIVGDMVCDITDFADLHPPGSKILKKYGGQNATAAMLSSGMPPQVLTTYIHKFCVGRVRLTMSEVARYTLAEVAARDGGKGQPLWIVYKDSVYDLSQYIYEHPGGYEAMMEEGGKDATKSFEDVGHSTDARAIMKKYKIGEIVEEEKRYDSNGKKKKRVIPAKPENEKSPNTRSCLNLITCGLLG